MQINQPLRSEAQLGQQLNVSVGEQRRYDFALLLAALSHDALDFAQFHLPKTPEQQNAHDSDSYLHRSLGAAKRRPSAVEQKDIPAYAQDREVLEQSTLTSVRLRDCMHPRALNIRDDKNYIEPAVIENCEPVIQAKVKNKVVDFSRPSIDPVAIYEQLNQLRTAEQAPI